MLPFDMKVFDDDSGTMVTSIIDQCKVRVTCTLYAEDAVLDIPRLPRQSARWSCIARCSVSDKLHSSQLTYVQVYRTTRHEGTAAPSLSHLVRGTVGTEHRYTDAFT